MLHSFHHLPLQTITHKRIAEVRNKVVKATCFNFIGNQYDSPSFQGYRAQNDHSQRDYPRQTLNAPETNNNHFGMGNRQEEAIFNPRGPGRGGTVNKDHLWPFFVLYFFHFLFLTVPPILHIFLC